MHVSGKLGFANSGGQPTSNYAFKPIAGQPLRPNQTIVPQRLNAALEFDPGNLRRRVH